MKQKLPFLMLLLMGLAADIFAQVTVSGHVTSQEDGEFLPGVAIVEKGTSNGTITDGEGNYKIAVSNGEAVLVFSYLGFLSEEVPVGASSTIDIVLIPDVLSLSEVVVTAFGIEREKDKLGYATTTVAAEEFAEAKQISFMQSLSGKVAGVNITAPPTGPAGSTNVLIRGLRSLTDDNRPLIIVDGVPIDNQIFEPAGKWGGRDGGDGLTSLNPDDIESVTVLKGASSTTIYGTNAQNGAIIITTKKGQGRKGVGVELNSNYVFEEVAIFPDYQDQYGQGVNGEAPTTAADATTFNSWGAPLNGQDVINFDGVARPYVALDRKENLKKYYNTGSTFTNSLSLVGGDENAYGRLSISQLDHKGIVPNTEYERLSFNGITNLKLGDRITAELKANYVRENALNRPNLSDNPSNPGKSLGLIPANIDIGLYEQNVRDENGAPIQVFNTPFTLNPYWGPYENMNSDDRDRFLGLVNLKYKVADWLTVQGRLSTDFYTQRLDNLEEIGTAHNVNGAVWNDTRKVKTENYDLLFLGSKNINEDFSVDYTVGLTQFNTSAEFFRSSGNQLVIRDKPNVNNAKNRNAGEYRFSSQRKNAVFATTTFGFKQFAYIDGAVRQEWLSTLTNPNDLSGSENSLVFGSVSGSLIFTEAFDLPEVISYGKFRASYGTAGGGTAPYRTVAAYNLEGFTLNGASLANISSNIFPNPNLRPNLTTSKEIGLEMSFLKRRISVDLTLYQTNTEDQILQAQLARSTGYENAVINAGEVENKGIELLLSGVPVETDNFTWEISANLARNRAEVVSLSGDQESLQLDDSRFGGVAIQHRVGRAPSELVGRRLLRDENGNIVHGTNGLPLQTEDVEVLGNFNPDLILGVTNTFRYKSFSLSFLIDSKQGGQVSSLSKLWALTRGLDKATLVGRDNPDFEIVGEGVNESGEPNDVPANLQTYYVNLAFTAETTVMDASYIKLREFRLNYTLPKTLMENMPFHSVTFGVVGRNLWYISNDLAELGVDPEALYNNSNAAGFEYASLPSTRSFGFNLNVKF